MTIKSLKEHFYSELDGSFPKEEIQSFFSLLSDCFLNYSRLDVALNAAVEVSATQLQSFENAIQRLKSHEPIQYIIGTTEFFGLPFAVNTSTLIPRPETEELVEWILKDRGSSSLEPFRLLDIGTGSGCIAISLSKHLKLATIDAVDISEKALKTARQNALLNEVAVNFSKLDVLKASQLPKKYDVIVSNPPYVRQLEKAQMEPNVLRYEPDGALYVNDKDPLLFYRKIGELASVYLEPNGGLYFEINEYLSAEMETLLKGQGFSEIEIKKDIFGKDRMMRCVRYE